LLLTVQSDRNGSRSMVGEDEDVALGEYCVGSFETAGTAGVVGTVDTVDTVGVWNTTGSSDTRRLFVL
jgi:hypothetical protein